jgi:hypothetical protein
VSAQNGIKTTTNERAWSGKNRASRTVALAALLARACNHDAPMHCTFP